MAITLTIGGAAVLLMLQPDSIRITDTLNHRNTAEFDLLVRDAYRPQVGQAVAIAEDGVTRFAGTLDAFEEAAVYDLYARRLRCQAVDFTQVLDRHLVARVYEAGVGRTTWTAGDISRDIVAQDLAGEGITTSHVEDGLAIAKIVFNYRPATAALDELAEMTGYAWYVDYGRDLHFFARESNTAPFALTDTSGNHAGLRVHYTRGQYRNRQYVRAGQDITAERTESFVGNGQQKTFTLAFPVAKVPSLVTVATGGGLAVPKTVGIRGLETGKDWYWNKGAAEITQDDAAAALAANQVLAVTYRGLVPIIAASQDDAEIAARAALEGGSGVYEAVADDQAIEKQDLALDKANALLRKFGHIPRVVEFETRTAGLAAGQLLSITSTTFGLSGQWLIESVDAVDEFGNQFVYRVRALDGETLGGWVDFFRKLAAAGQQFVIRENEVLLQLRRLTDKAVLCLDTITVSTPAPAESRVGYAMAGFGEVGA